MSGERVLLLIADIGGYTKYMSLHRSRRGLPYMLRLRRAHVESAA